jgi:peptidoglycan/LPS O-acetylase OafA/YrhL
MIVGVTLWPLFVWEVRPISSRRWPTVGVALSAAAAYFLISIGLDIHRDNLLVYLWGVASIIAVFYISYGWFSSIPTISAWLQLLGRYSLVSYLLQMTIIRLALGTQSHFGLALSYGLIFLLVLFMVGLTIFMLDKEIRKSKTIQKSYRLVFG